MKLTRILSLAALAGLAIAGAIALNSQPRNVQAQTQLPSRQIAQQTTADTTISPEIAEFLRNPTQYQFACGEAPGRVTSASVEGSTLTIGYTYPAGNEIRTGQLVGSISQDGRFSGTYDTQSRLGRFQGDITFTFAADGTASGRYGNGAGSARIFL